MLVSADIALEKVEEACAALAIQAQRDLCPAWGLLAPSYSVVSNVKDVPKDANVINVLRTSDVDDALGYHTIDSRGMPVGYAFTDGLDEEGITTVMSHEAGEMIVDPYVQEWMYSYVLSMHFAKEPFDPVEGHTYKIHNVTVGDFVLPSYFSDWTPPSAAVDFLHALAGPWSVDQDGYITAMKDGKTLQLPPEAKMSAARQHPLSRVQRRLAAPPRPARTSI